MSKPDVTPAQLSAGRRARLEYAAETGNGVTQDMLQDALQHIAYLTAKLQEAQQEVERLKALAETTRIQNLKLGEE